MKLFIPVICYNHTCHTSYMFSLMRLVIVLKDMGIATSLFPITFDSLINRARNAAVAYFLTDTEHTHLLFLDADIEFSVKNIIDMIEADKDVIGIGYAQKWLNIDKLNKVFSKTPVPENPLELCTNASVHLLSSANKETIQEVEYCTTGCLLIKRKVFETMISRYPERQYKNDVDGYANADVNNFYNLFSVEINPTTLRFESEDYSFCRLWRECGGTVHTLLDASLTHYGWFGYKNNIFRQIEIFES